jgi:Uma2 family endonuclease
MPYEAKPEILVTLEEFECVPESNRYKLELSRGHVVREPRPGARHGIIWNRVYDVLLQHGQRAGYGICVAHAGFLLASEPPTVREPDIAFITRERLPADLPDGFWAFAPDLAVEVISPSNTVSAINDKVLQYLEGGSRLVWVVDPRTHSVCVYRSLHDIRILRRGDVLDGTPVIPGLSVSLETLLADWTLPS